MPTHLNHHIGLGHTRVGESLVKKEYVKLRGVTGVETGVVTRHSFVLPGLDHHTPNTPNTPNNSCVLPGLDHHEVPRGRSNIQALREGRGWGEDNTQVQVFDKMCMY